MRLEYFQMIDRFVDVQVEERRIRAVCTVPKESPVFEGHFPGYPLMPGVLLIECMAQTCGWLVSAVTGFVGLPVLAGVREAKIRAAVFPGDALEFEGRIAHVGSGYAMADGKGRSKDALVCEARLTYSLVPYPNAEFRKVMREWAERIEFPLAEFAT